MAWQPPPSRVTLDIEMPTPQPFELNPRTTAVVVVDMQVVYLRPVSPNRITDSIPGTAALLDRARAAGATIVYIQSVRTPDNLERTRFGRTAAWLDQINIGSPGADIVPELAPLPTDAIVQKQSHDPWTNPELESVLAERGITPVDGTLIVAGVSAAVCAHATALGAANRNFMTLIPMDATAAPVEDEAMVYRQYMSTGYSYAMAFTRSDLVTFAAHAAPAEAQVLARSAGAPSR